MKLRRRPLAQQNCDSQYLMENQKIRKRQRNASDVDLDDSDEENDPSAMIYAESQNESKNSQRSLIRTRSGAIAAAVTKRNNFTESVSDEDYVESESDEESSTTTVFKQPKTRMVTRQMSLIMNNQAKSKVKVQPFVDQTEDSLSESIENGKATRLRPRRVVNNRRISTDNEAQFFVRTAPIDDDDSSQPAAFSSVKKDIFIYYKTPKRPDKADIDYEQLVNRTRIKPASMDHSNQGQLLPDENVDEGNQPRPTELIPYLLELEQSLMPLLPIIKQKKKSKKLDSSGTASVVYPRRIQTLLDYLYGSQRCLQISKLIRLHMRSRLVLNTLFLAVNLFDRAILTGLIPVETYANDNPHLLLTCLLIAGKFEEVEWPSITSLIGSRTSLTANDIKSLEIVVLQSLSFDIGLTVLDFVYRYCEISPMDKSSEDLRLLFFILQLLLIDPQTFIAHKSSYIAACSYALVRHLKQYDVTWPRRLARSTGYDPTEIAYGVTKVARQCLRAFSSNEQQEAIHRDLMNKYSKGPAGQLVQYEEKLIDLIQPVGDDE